VSDWFRCPSPDRGYPMICQICGDTLQQGEIVGEFDGKFVHERCLDDEREDSDAYSG
jgi:hypothetical protein